MITADNGKDFAYHEQMTEALDAQVYFAVSFCLCEWGLNENTNGLLWQYRSKKKDLKEILGKGS